MPASWEILKLLADPTRLRLLNLLRTEELSVAELQEALGMGQSRISTHLGLLRGVDVVMDRRQGKKSFYQLNPGLGKSDKQLIAGTLSSFADDTRLKDDLDILERILQKRRQVSERYFNQVAGRLGKHYCPGRSWEAIGHFLLHLTPRIHIADLGAGEGVLSQLLAQRAEQVYCVDSSRKMVEFGTELAKKNGIENLIYKLGDIEDVPLEDSSVDLALLSQALHHAAKPPKAIAEACRILKPGGKLVILDLKEHTFEKARELYADEWLGFSENRIYHWLKDAGFTLADVSIVSREQQEPHFETLLASGIKPE